MNQKNSLGLNSCFMDLDDPLELFKIWMAEAEKNELNDPNALSLATTSASKEPSVRMVLLKGLSSKGFVFYTNLNSPKSNDLIQNPKAAMCFHWKSIQRQVRISGSVKQVSDKEADLYFNTRSYDKKVTAIISDQSSVMKDRSELIKRIENFKSKNKEDKKITRPKNWSGWSLTPISYEFWLGYESRNHERLRYKKITNTWKKEILYP